MDVRAEWVQERAARTSRGMLAALFVVYLAVLAWLVLWKLHEPFVGTEGMRSLKLTPFVAAEGFGASRPPEVAGNVVVFVPFGLYLGLLAPRWSWLRVAAATGLTSLVFEIAQYVLAVGSTDASDVIANSAGGILGVALAALVRGRPRSVATTARALAVGTLVMLASVALVVAGAPRLPGLPVGIG